VHQFAPLSAGDIFGGCMLLYRSNFRLFAGTTGVLAVAQAILASVVYVAKLPIPLSLALSLVLTLLFTPLATGVLAQAITTRFQGHQISVRQVYASIGWPLFSLLVAASVLLTIAVGIGCALLVIPGLYLFVRLLFVPQAIVLEHTSVREAFSRSSQLVRGSWWRVFGIGVLVNLPAIPGVAVVGLLITLAGALWGSGAAGIAQVLAPSLLVPTVVWPIPLTAATMLYYDLRVRQEGFSLQPAGAE
jgi:hypothetical protein